MEACTHRNRLRFMACADPSVRFVSGSAHAGGDHRPFSEKPLARRRLAVALLFPEKSQRGVILRNPLHCIRNDSSPPSRDRAEPCWNGGHGNAAVPCGQGRRAGGAGVCAGKASTDRYAVAAAGAGRLPAVLSEPGGQRVSQRCAELLLRRNADALFGLPGWLPAGDAAADGHLSRDGNPRPNAGLTGVQGGAGRAADLHRRLSRHLFVFEAEASEYRKRSLR